MTDIEPDPEVDAVVLRLAQLSGHIAELSAQLTNLAEVAGRLAVQLTLLPGPAEPAPGDAADAAERIEVSGVWCLPAELEAQRIAGSTWLPPGQPGPTC